MNPEELAELGISVHLIKGYGDTAVAECAIALMWKGTGLAKMDREMRAGNWAARDGMQLHRPRRSPIGSRIGGRSRTHRARSGMRVIAWNRFARKHPKVEFVDLTNCSPRATSFQSICAERQTRGLISPPASRP